VIRGLALDVAQQLSNGALRGRRIFGCVDYRRRDGEHAIPVALEAARTVNCVGAPSVDLKSAHAEAGKNGLRISDGCLAGCGVQKSLLSLVALRTKPQPKHMH
jgi:hypothetical protein